jgi:shikimate kinase
VSNGPAPNGSAASSPAPGSRAPLAVLIGPPGSGKTTVGTLLAELLGVGFLDTDASVEAVAGKPVPDIFVEDGEPAFRELERAAVAAAIRENGAGRVVGLGGGAVLDVSTRELLAGHRVVYLETGFTDLAKRVGLDRPRPLLIGINPRAQLKTLLEQREPVYAGLAQVTVSTDGREPAQIAAEVAELLSANAGHAARQPGQ